MSETILDTQEIKDVDELTEAEKAEIDKHSDSIVLATQELSFKIIDTINDYINSEEAGLVKMPDVVHFIVMSAQSRAIAICLANVAEEVRPMVYEKCMNIIESHMQMSLKNEFRWEAPTCDMQH